MAKVRFKANIDGFAQLRQHPKLVAGMEAAAERGAAGTPYEVDTFPHQGRRTGPRTAVQVWARSPKAQSVVDDNPGSLTGVLSRVRL